jgi:hypothetical protein
LPNRFRLRSEMTGVAVELEEEPELDGNPIGRPVAVPSAIPRVAARLIKVDRVIPVRHWVGDHLRDLCLDRRGVGGPARDRRGVDDVMIVIIAIVIIAIVIIAIVITSSLRSSS